MSKQSRDFINQPAKSSGEIEVLISNPFFLIIALVRNQNPPDIAGEMGVEDLQPIGEAFKTLFPGDVIYQQDSPGSPVIRWREEKEEEEGKMNGRMKESKGEMKRSKVQRAKSKEIWLQVAIDLNFSNPAVSQTCNLTLSPQYSIVRIRKSMLSGRG